LLRIARCESALNPRAVNGDHFGLFQFRPSTFRSGAVDMLAATGISTHSYWNARDSAYVAGFLFAVGQSPDWTCQ
jgi:soluble lytic murein transglycosylase-like protein